MLTQEQISINKQKFVELLTTLNIDVSNIVQYLDSNRVLYFTKPYNNYPEYSYEGSLCEHSLKLFAELKKLCELYFPGRYTDSDIILVALFKDIYRAELYEAYNKNVKNEVTNQWETQTAYRNKEVRPIFGDIGFSSYMITSKFITLSNDEIVEAICYAGNNSNIEIHNIRKDYPLVVLTTMAELAVNYLKESTNE